jgi:AmmeMemoRadiSam system protein A
MGVAISKMAPYEPLTAIARDAIAARLEGRARRTSPRLGENLDAPGGLFVTLHGPDDALRGCMGLTHPVDDVASAVAEMAVTAAVRDVRFSPVSREELDDLRIEVSLLDTPERVRRLAELDPVRYGVLVEQNGKRGVLLPDQRGVDHAAEQIAIACRKGGIVNGRPFRTWRFSVRRFSES